MITRVLDLAVLLLVAVAVLLPRPDVHVQPALRLSAVDRERVAELEARVYAKPEDVAGALELSDLYLDGRRPDWAVAIATRAIQRAPGDHRLWGRRALALADHFAAEPAYEAASRARALCESGSTATCGPSELARLTLLHDTLASVKDIDMRKDPNAAKERILKALRPAFVPGPKPAAKAPKAPSSQGASKTPAKPAPSR